MGERKEVTMTELLLGRSLCVIGGSDTIDKDFMHLHGCYFVRINWHYLTQGGPVDAIYASTFRRDIKFPPVKWIGCELGKPYHLYVKDLESNKNISEALYSPICYTLEMDGWNTKTGDLFKPFLLELDTKPSTGLLAIYDLLNYPIREIYITGFNFYEVAPFRLLKNQNNHDFEKQFKWLKAMWKKDKRIVLDETLLRLFSSDVIFIDNSN